jgi:fatty acid desaturase
LGNIVKITEILDPDELSLVTSKHNGLAALPILTDWSIIISVFVLMSIYTNPFSILLGTFILGGRMLGLGVVVHEAGHRDNYMQEHLEHHRQAGTEKDPDLNNYKNYPIDRKSFKRKITRDLTGQVGWRRIKSIARATRRFSSLNNNMKQYLLRCYALNLIMLLTMGLFGEAWLYLTWVVAFMTSHMFVTRIRQIAEHAAVPDLFDVDPRRNTRTLYISWLERLLIAPHGVNYHMEHHLLASAPIYRLSAMHRMLLKKGYYCDVDFQRGYLSLLRQVVGN